MEPVLIKINSSEGPKVEMNSVEVVLHCSYGGLKKTVLKKPNTLSDLLDRRLTNN